MVLSHPTRPPVTAGVAEPAVVVPDPLAWALWGEDLAELGIVEAASPAAADAMVVPEAVPPPLEDAVRAAWDQMPPSRRLVELPAPTLAGRSAAELLEGASPARADDEEGDHHGHEHGHDHGDMMEITGDPSSDGLVMESIELEHGPLAPALPGGLVIAAELDGDVVSGCEVRATLRAPAPGPEPWNDAMPDPLASIAWRLALGKAVGAPEPAANLAIAALEWERALSHLLWLRSLALVLGWDELHRRARPAASPLIRAHPAIARTIPPGPAGDGGHGPEPQPLLAAGRDAALDLYDFLEGNRRLALRTRGRAVVRGDEADRRGLRGPSARASGLAIDSRAGDSRYRGLGFTVRTSDGGDAEARVLQRAAEACDALAIALSALGSGAIDGGGEPPSSVTVESPRGPVRAAPPVAPGASPSISAPGAAASRTLAGELAVGLEWSTALACIASFDLSPWEVPG